MSALICTPIRGGMVHVQHAVGILQSTGLFNGWLPHPGQSDIYVARCVLANEFLKTPFDDLLFIDSDVGFSRKMLQDLIESEGDVVSGLVPDKSPVPVALMRGLDSKPIPVSEIPPEGMIEVGMVPCAFLKIRRKVLTTLLETNAVAKYGPDGIYGQFFAGLIENEHLLSEDYSFSKLCRAAGFKLWVNCGIRVDHDGRRL